MLKVELPYTELSNMDASNEMNILVSPLEEKIPVRKYFELYLLSHFEKRQKDKNDKASTNRVIDSIIEEHKNQNHSKYRKDCNDLEIKIKNKEVLLNN